MLAQWLCRGSLNVAWRVHRVLHDGSTTTRVLLHSAAYDRYLALAAASPNDDPAPPGHVGHRVGLGDYDGHQNVDPILLKAVGSGRGRRRRRAAAAKDTSSCATSRTASSAATKGTDSGSAASRASPSTMWTRAR